MEIFKSYDAIRNNNSLDDLFSYMITEQRRELNNQLRQDSKEEKVFMPKNFIKKVKFNDPATIVWWTDGTKTVVKCQEGQFDKWSGLAFAICKKVFGNKGNFNEVFKKWIKDDEPTEEVKGK